VPKVYWTAHHAVDAAQTAQILERIQAKEKEGTWPPAIVYDEFLGLKWVCLKIGEYPQIATFRGKLIIHWNWNMGCLIFFDKAKLRARSWKSLGTWVE
jgi:hypothetical protein